MNFLTEDEMERVELLEADRRDNDEHVPYGRAVEAAVLAKLRAMPPVAWTCIWPDGGHCTHTSREGAEDYMQGAWSVKGRIGPRLAPLHDLSEEALSAPTKDKP